jgi:hypothetical protein
VILMRYEHHLYIKSKTIPAKERGRPHVFPFRYDYHLHVESKAIPVTGRKDQQVCFL